MFYGADRPMRNCLEKFSSGTHFTLSPQRGERAKVRGKKFFKTERL